MAGRWAAVVGVLLLLPLLPLVSSSMVFKLDGNVYPTGYVHDLLSTSSISLWCRPKRCQMQKAIISVYSVLSCKRMVLFVCLQFQQTSEMQQFGLCFFFLWLLSHFYVTMNIGEPAKPYFLDIDTGSNLTWLECNAVEKGPCLTCNKARSLLQASFFSLITHF